MWLDDSRNEYTEEQVMEKILAAVNDCQIVVGTDSNQFKTKYRFATAICLYNKGKGGTYFYLLTYEDRKTYKGKNHKMRIFSEAAKSIEISEKIFEKTGTKPVIHIDVSIKEKGHYTSDFSDSVKGYVIASGYDYRIKDESWAASSVADRHSKQ